MTTYKSYQFEMNTGGAFGGDSFGMAYLSS